MTPTPTGRLIRRSDDGYDLVLTRSFPASADDVWASITESERTARWFGAWEGEPGIGRTVRIRLGFEEGAPWSEARIDACEPPRHLAPTTSVGDAEWHLDATVTETDGVTELVFVHHLDDAGAAGDIGPGWEYYLDLLVASRDGDPLPGFADYYPAQSAHFTSQA